MMHSWDVGIRLSAVTDITTPTWLPVTPIISILFPRNKMQCLQHNFKYLIHFSCQVSVHVGLHFVLNSIDCGK